MTPAEARVLRAPILGRVDLARQLWDRRRSGELKRVVLANGCFDVLHPGHLDYLDDAARRGDALIVALNTDESVRSLKGEGRPLHNLADRSVVLASLRCVDFVVSFPEETLHRTLRLLTPDVHAKGTDYTRETVPERELDLELGIEIAICGSPKMRSSSELIDQLAGGTAPA